MKKVMVIGLFACLLLYACTRSYPLPTDWTPTTQRLKFVYLDAGNSDTLLQYPFYGSIPVFNTSMGQQYTFLQLDQFMDTVLLIQWTADSTFLKDSTGKYGGTGHFTIIDSTQLEASLGYFYGNPRYPGTIQVKGGGLGAFSKNYPAIGVDYQYCSGFVQTYFAGYLLSPGSGDVCYLEGNLGFFHR